MLTGCLGRTPGYDVNQPCAGFCGLIEVLRRNLDEIHDGVGAVGARRISVGQPQEDCAKRASICKYREQDRQVNPSWTHMRKFSTKLSGLL